MVLILLCNLGCPAVGRESEDICSLVLPLPHYLELIYRHESKCVNSKLLTLIAKRNIVWSNPVLF